MKIIFTDNTKKIPAQYAPKPASNFVPEWYKNLNSYLGDKKEPNGEGQAKETIKKCMPVFDAITAGYILVTPSDVWVSLKPNTITNKLEPYFEWASFDLIDFHPVTQAPNHPNKNGHDVAYPKFMNPWSIKTPKGYSTFFTQPMHRESPFTILDGIVDTDVYTIAVNFPFVLNDINFEGLIPAGTPMAQVIPFKRDKWELQLGTEKQIQENEKNQSLLRTKFFDGYKTHFRQKKEYK
jgi:hypothetical protein